MDLFDYLDEASAPEKEETVQKKNVTAGKKSSAKTEKSPVERGVATASAPKAPVSPSDASAESAASVSAPAGSALSKTPEALEAASRPAPRPKAPKRVVVEQDVAVYDDSVPASLGASASSAAAFSTPAAGVSAAASPAAPSASTLSPDAGPAFAAQGASWSEAGANHVTVTELSNRLRLFIEQTFQTVAVEGEITGLKRAASGHIYFRLKDEENVIDAVMWRGSAEKLAFDLKDGAHVLASAKVTTYGAQSRYQLVVHRLEPVGQGALMLRFEALKRQLQEEGLFAAARKRPLPFLPQTIGIITSDKGAVIHDMLNRLRARCPRHVLLWPVPVQGVGAKEALCEAISGFSALPAGHPLRPDVLIVARGGGSLEDLWAFNEEMVVRAVAESTIPVVSGVGHEPDVTLCDFAADVRAPTPTAAAEMVVPVRSQLLLTLTERQQRGVASLQRKMAHLREALQYRRARLPDPVRTLEQSRLRLDERQQRLQGALAHFMRTKKQPFMQLETRLNPYLLTRLCDLSRKRLENVPLEKMQHMMEHRLSHQKKWLGERHARLLSSAPDLPLKRGFTYVTDEDGALVKVSSTAAKKVQIHFVDGVRKATLEN